MLHQLLQSPNNQILGCLLRLASRIQQEEKGQDMIEYGLMAAAIAIAVAAIFPSTINPSISQIFSKVSSTLVATSSSGS